jgi:hypothetical protein
MAKAYKDCIKAIQNAAGDWLSPAQAEKLLEQIDGMATERRLTSAGENIAAKMQKDLEKTGERLIESSLIQKRNALLNKQTKAKILNQLAGFKTPGLGLEALLAGKHTRAEGALFSIDAQTKALSDKMLGKLISSLEQDNLLPFLASGKFDKEIAKELFELPNGRVGISNSTEARKIASIMHSIQNELVVRQNAAGAAIKLRPGYIVRQSHDMHAIRAVGPDKWITDITPLLDESMTFGNMSKEEFLQEAYDGFATGMHYKAKGEDAADDVSALLGFKGPGNLAKKVSSERVLHFKDSDAWFTYNEMYGKQSLRDSLIHGVENSSRNIALMENLGTNPRRMLEDVIQTVKQTNKKDIGNFESVNDYKLNVLYEQLDGSARIPVNVSVARISAGIRAVQNMAKLGASVLSSITDIPFQASTLRLNGVNVLSAYGDGITSIMRGRGTAEQKEIARLIGVGFDGIIKDAMSRFAPDEDIPGLLSKTQQKFFKLNGMSWWNDSHKTGVALVLSNHIAEQAKTTAYKDLQDSFKTILSQYKITEKEWGLVKDLTFDAEDGMKYFTPDKLADIPDSRIIDIYGFDKTDSKPALSRKIANARNDLETRWRTYYSDQITHAIPHPGAAEQAMWILGGGSKPGTALGEAIRFIGQFKSFPITAVRKGMAPQIYNQGANTFVESLTKGKANYSGIVQLIVGTTIFGYMANTAKDFAKGLTPQDPNNHETWVRAMASGGGLGLYGDFLFGEFNRYGQSPIATLSGPTLSNVEDMLRLYSKLKDQDESAKNSAIKIVKNNLPFANMFYTKAALDYMIMFELQESINPGYLSRMEQSIMERTGQSFYIPPSGEIAYGGN